MNINGVLIIAGIVLNIIEAIILTRIYQGLRYSIKSLKTNVARLKDEN